MIGNLDWGSSRGVRAVTLVRVTETEVECRAERCSPCVHMDSKFRRCNLLSGCDLKLDTQGYLLRCPECIEAERTGKAFILLRRR